jgi:predicted amidohydrolase YtcJ
MGPSSAGASADLVLLNGRVITVDANDTLAQAVAVRGERIVRVGSNESVKELAGPRTRVVDLAGRALTPGFFENHMHIPHAVENLGYVDCSPAAVSSIADLVARIAQRVRDTPPGEWVFGWGFDHHRLSDQRYPTRRDLDPVSPNHPVAIVQREAMSWTANTLGLRRMGVYDDTPDPPGGPMLRDESGAPLGPMWDNCRVEFVFPIIPQLTAEQLRDGYRWVCGYLNRLGITSADEAAVREPGELQAWQMLRDAGDLTARIYLNLYPVYGAGWDTENVSYQIFRSGLRTGFGDDWLRLGPAVIGVDGGVQGQTAALYEPYANDPTGSFRGCFRATPEMVEEFCIETHRAGYQIAAIPHGDHAIGVTLDAIEKAMQLYPRPDPRHRLEHAYLWNPETIDKAARLKVIYNAQPPILEVLSESCTIEAWGEKRAQFAFPFRSLLERGVIISGGSDMPIVSSDPLLGIDCLVNRRLDPHPGARVLNERERLSVLDAIRVYTYNGAYAHFEEGVKGSIEEGKLADLAILSQDILRVPTEEIREITVDMTVVGGRIVYDTMAGTRDGALTTTGHFHAARPG